MIHKLILSRSLGILLLMVIVIYSCTQPPKFSYVSQFPEIKPEGNFYDFIRALKTDNENFVISMIAPKIFVYVQDKQKFQNELFLIISTNLKQIFNTYTFAKTFESFSYFYNTEGEFQSAIAYTKFRGIMTSQITSDNENESFSPEISVIWEISGNNWLIVYLGLNDKNLLRFDQKSTD